MHKVFRVALVACLAFASLARGEVAADRPARFLSSGELRVCIRPDHRGLTYRKPDSASLSGLDIDLALHFGKVLGVPVSFVDSTLDQVERQLRDHVCDLATDASSLREFRPEGLTFSEPYLRSDVRAVVQTRRREINSWGDLERPGRVVAVDGTTQLGAVTRGRLGQGSVLVVLPPATGFGEVMAGRADAFLTDYATARYFAGSNPAVRLLAPVRPFHVTERSWVIALHDAALLQRFDAYLRQVKADGQLRQLARRHQLDAIVIAP